MRGRIVQTVYLASILHSAGFVAHLEDSFRGISCLVNDGPCPDGRARGMAQGLIDLLKLVP